MRVLVTSATLAIAAGLALLLLRVLLKEGFGFLPRELLAVSLGALAYIPMFGLVHLYNRRGLITNLSFLFLLDIPLGKVPFSLRNISPSYHVGVIADQQEVLRLPVSLGLPPTSVVMSVIVLVSIALVFGVALAIGFKRKNLGELC